MRLCTWADPVLSPAMTRVSDALTTYRPEGTFITTNADQADLVVLHVIGYPETVKAIKHLHNTGGRYAIMQYCLRSTQKPNTRDWIDLWQGAECVWSYYDLNRAMAEDGIDPEQTMGHDWYCHAPLGADPNVFRPSISVGARYGILTSGYVAASECIEECFHAAARVGRRVFHLGPEREFYDIAGPHVDFGFGIPDDELARRYSSSDFVAGMRRCEGFEMPAVEGLFCGARPLMLDRPHYRAWFDEWAVFVPELAPAQLTDEIEKVLRTGVEPLTDGEIAAARKRFDWQSLVENFWRRALGKEFS